MPTVERLVERVPPHSLDTEMAVLGSMLMDEEAVPVALEMLQSSSFYRDAHRKVFEAMTGLFNGRHNKTYAFSITETWTTAITSGWSLMLTGCSPKLVIGPSSTI